MGDIDSDSGASTNLDFIPGTQEEEECGVPGPPTQRRWLEIREEVLSDEEGSPLGPASPPPRGALPAEERLMRERTRLRCVSLLTNVGQSLLEHCQEETQHAAASEQSMYNFQVQEGEK
ncbi:uncharacterized protein LOC143831155 [Paroedura picta]|uniref:uncharacterized protein LOC143831155 n=1 Tax=Paroedura picta TaxID=143630 RepID=UPI0040567D99